jgi:hypothetical protein
MKQVPCRGPTVLESAGNLTVIWHFLLGACELINMFTSKEKKPAIIVPKMLGATMQYVVSLAARFQGFVHPQFLLPPTYPDDRDGYNSGILHPGLNGAHLPDCMVSYSIFLVRLLEFVRSILYLHVNVGIWDAIVKKI